MTLNPLQDLNLTVRPGTLDDAEIVAYMLNLCALEETGERRFLAVDLRTDWQRPSFHLKRDSRIVVAPDGRTVGFAVVFDPEPHVHLLAGADVPPNARGQGIGSVLCAWIEERSRRSLSLAPAGAKVILAQEKMAANQFAAQLLLARGYRLTRHSLRMRIEMDAPPAPPVVPSGIEIRPFHRKTEARALVCAIRESFSGSWGYVDRPFDVEYADWMHLLDTDNNVDPSLWFVAVEGDEVVGTLLCHPQMAEDPELAWVYALSVRPAWRRRGLGLALLRHSFGALYGHGKPKVGLDVDAANLTGATRLYEKAGMSVLHQSNVYELTLRSGARSQENEQ